jgi:hypothetical protein
MKFWDFNPEEHREAMRREGCCNCRRSLANRPMIAIGQPEIYLKFICIFLKPQTPLTVQTRTGALLFPGLSAAPPGDYIPPVRRCAFRRCPDADAPVPWVESAHACRRGRHPGAQRRQQTGPSILPLT